MNVLALIPARGGSKSVPRKNLRLIGGKPLIAHSIEQALQSKRITRVICSTDDEEIAETAEKFGAEVPFLRPASISGDYAVDFDFHLHALLWLKENEDYIPDQVVQLRPTNPFRNVATIDRAIDALAARPDADSLRAIRPVEFTPYKMWRKENGDFLEPILKLENESEPYNLPRQKLPEIFQQDGYIDITRPNVVFEKKSTTGKKILPFLIEEDTIDIDYESDMIVAEDVFQKSKDD